MSSPTDVCAREGCGLARHLHVNEGWGSPVHAFVEPAAQPVAKTIGHTTITSGMLIPPLVATEASTLCPYCGKVECGHFYLNSRTGKPLEAAPPPASVDGDVRAIGQRAFALAVDYFSESCEPPTKASLCEFLKQVIVDQRAIGYALGLKDGRAGK